MSERSGVAMMTMNELEREYNFMDAAAAGSPGAPRGESLPSKVGSTAPDFEAINLDGGMIRLGDFFGRRHLVIMTGAVTSPMCAFEVPAFNQLREEFDGRDVSFLLLYTRESHPAENYRSHSSLEQKIAYARDLQRLEGVSFPVIVDHLDGRIHRAYGVWPNALYVIHKDSRLIFRSNIANHDELRQFLDDLMTAEQAVANNEVLHMQYSERVIAHVADRRSHRRVYERAGSRAFEDYWAKRPQYRDRWP